jgi:hypothetical protein
MKKELLTCPICKNEFVSLNSHIHFKHKLSTEEFLKQYPNTKLVSDSIKQKVSESCKKSGCGKWMKGYKFSNERKEKYSKMNSGKGNPFFGKKHSKKTKKLMSNNHADFMGENNPLVKWLNKDDKNREEYSRIMKEVWKNPKNAKILSERNSKAIESAMLNGNYNPYSNCLHGWFESKKFATKFYYQSSYELKFLEFCESSPKITNLEKSKFVIPYVDKNGQKRKYFPDFLVNKNILIEIKPKSMVGYNNNEEKIEFAKKYCFENGLKYKLLMEKELNDLNKNI